MKKDERASPVLPTGQLYYDGEPEKKEDGTDKGAFNHGIFANEDFNGGGCTATGTHPTRAISLQAKNRHNPWELEIHWNPPE